MRAIILTFLLALPAHAQDVADFGGTGCAISLVADQPHVAEVLCTNVETTGNAWSPGIWSCTWRYTTGLAAFPTPSP